MLHQLEEGIIPLLDIAKPIGVKVYGDQNPFHHGVLVFESAGCLVQIIAYLGCDLPDALPAGTLRNEELMFIRIVPGQLFIACLLFDPPGLFFEHIGEPF